MICPSQNNTNITTERCGQWRACGICRDEDCRKQHEDGPYSFPYEAYSRVGENMTRAWQKSCGNCANWVPIKSLGAGLCELEDAKASTDCGRKCINWKGKKYDRRKQQENSDAWDKIAEVWEMGRE